MASNRSCPIFEGGRLQPFESVFSPPCLCVSAFSLLRSDRKKKKRCSRESCLLATIKCRHDFPVIFPNLSPPTSSLCSTSYPVLLASIFDLISHTKFLRHFFSKLRQHFFVASIKCFVVSGKVI